MWGPKVFRLLAQHWGVPLALQRVWWQALERARWPSTVAWRDQLLTYAPRPRAQVRQWLVATCLPEDVIKVLEDLVAEGCLTRGKATRIEECLLQRLDRDGAWTGTGERR